MKVMIFVKESHCSHQPLIDRIVSLIEKQGWSIPVVVVNIETYEGLTEAKKWGIFVVPTVIVAGNRKSAVISQGREQPTQEVLEGAIFGERRKERSLARCL